MADSRASSWPAAALSGSKRAGISLSCEKCCQMPVKCHLCMLRVFACPFCVARFQLYHTRSIVPGRVPALIFAVRRDDGSRWGRYVHAHVISIYHCYSVLVVILCFDRCLHSGVHRPAAFACVCPKEVFSTLWKWMDGGLSRDGSRMMRTRLRCVTFAGCTHARVCVCSGIDTAAGVVAAEAVFARGKRGAHHHRRHIQEI